MLLISKVLCGVYRPRIRNSHLDSLTAKPCEKAFKRDADMAYKQPIFLSLLVAIFASGCITHEELINFSQGEPYPKVPQAITTPPELEIQPDDLISIRVYALDLEAALPFNVDPPTMNVNQMGDGSNRPLFGYLVDNKGYIDFPILGSIRAGGLTTDQLKGVILAKLKSYLKDPVVTVRFLNFRLTVLGEVSRPGSYLVANERLSILDALGLAGDVTPYANRMDVQIVREENGYRTYATLNLQDRDIFKSPYFYLQQNDLVYVSPLEERTASLRDQSQRALPYLSAGVTLVTLILTIFNRR
jgi:polysaccharide export outer membrane protein